MLIAAVIVARAQYAADLSAFLPRFPSQAQELLVQQLRNGPVSRLILIGIEGAGDEDARVRLSRDLAQRLRSNAAFRSVQNGEAVNFARDRDFLVKYRYLLSERVTPERFAGPGLQSALQEGIDLLSSSVGFLSRDLFVRDPTGETLAVLAQLDETTSRPKSASGVWVSKDNSRALLVAETRAEGADSDGQEHAIATIRSTFEALNAQAGVDSAATATLRLTGPGVFADEARATIKAEVLRLSVLSSILIATLLLCVYRSLPAVVLGFLPVTCGALAGVAAVALGFGVVHGVTLGFGVTLIGESIDYSIYHFLQASPGVAGGQQNYSSTTALWPIIRLGLLTSVCGFASLLPSGFPGLAQLGLYSIVGLVVAGLVTRFVLPVLIPRGLTIHPAASLGASFSRSLAVIRKMRAILWFIPVLAAIVLSATVGRLWNHDLSALSPVPQSAQALDAEIRADLGAPDVRTLVIVSGPDSQSVLRATEAVDSKLQELVEQSAIAGFQTPTRYVPSHWTQERRRASLPSPNELRARLQMAAELLPVEARQLDPFVEDVAAARSGPLISSADLKGTDFESAVDALLVKQGTRWNALLPLQAIGTGLIDVQRVTRAIASAASQDIQITVLDLKQASDDLYASYLSEAIGASLGGLAAIIVLLWITLRSIVRVARVVAPLILAVLVVMSGFLLAGHMLTIMHLVGLLLVFAIGSNYALFFAREKADADVAESNRILASLLIASTTTVIGFGVLAFSTVSVLADLGSTVAPGAFLALLFSAALAGDTWHVVESA